MAAEYLVEYTLTPEDQGYRLHPGVHTTTMGRVIFDPNPEFGHRRVVVVDTEEKQKELLNNGNIGYRHGKKRTLVEPTDLVTAQERIRIRSVVLEVLSDQGMMSQPKVEVSYLPPTESEKAAGAEIDAVNQALVEDQIVINATDGAISLAKELGVNLSAVQFSDADGRVTKADVRNFVAQTE